MKRIMLLAVVRPVVEYGATVWNANAPQHQAALESVQHQILSSMTGCANTTSTHILRIETGCRSFESWADQRKLEYFFRKLQEMPDCRLPKMVWQHNWQEGRRQLRRAGEVRCGMLTLGRLPSRLAWRSWQQCVMLRIAIMLPVDPCSLSAYAGT